MEPKVIDNLIESCKNKSSTMRAKCSLYFCTILGTWHEYILDKYGDAFKQYFETSLADASSDCRHYSRLAFIRFREIFPKEADDLFDKLDPAIQKAINDEEANGGKIRSPTDYRGISPHEGSTKLRKGTHSAMRQEIAPKPTAGYLSPGTNMRRTEISRKTNSRFQNKSNTNKFLSEERSITDKNKRGMSKDAALSTGFKNLKAVQTTEQDNEAKGMYISKYHKPMATTSCK